MAEQLPPVVHQQEAPTKLNPELRSAIHSAGPTQLRAAIIELCKQMPDAGTSLSSILAASAQSPSAGLREPSETREADVVVTRVIETNPRKRSRTQSAGKEVKGKPAPKKRVVKKRKTVEICDECGEEAKDSDDGCCKWRKMQRYE